MTLMQPLEAAGCGCDALDATQGLVSIAEALEEISSWVSNNENHETVPLDQAQGRTLARPVRAQGMTPPFDNSAMDGYAVNTASLVGEGPWKLSVKNSVRAGGTSAAPVGAGKAVQIFTGAPVPQGADAVIMQEHVLREGDQITLTQRPVSGAHVRVTGEDMATGQEVMPAGRKVGSAEIAVLAAAGCAMVSVNRRPKVAILTTGDEVRCAGRELETSAIWDVNSPMLVAAIQNAGGEIVQVAHGTDNLPDLRATLEELAEIADVVVTTGGISVGAADFVKPAIEQLGGDIWFSGVAVKPGKPVSFGRVGAAYWLGLPGNPVSALVTWTLFGTQILNGLSGADNGCSKRRHVVASSELSHRTGRCELRLATLSGFDGLGRELVNCPADTQSARVSRLTDADGLVFIPAETESICEGGLLEFLPFSN